MGLRLKGRSDALAVNVGETGSSPEVLGVCPYGLGSLSLTPRLQPE